MPIVRQVYCDMCGAPTDYEFYVIDAARHIKGEKAEFSDDVLILCPLCMQATGLGKRLKFVERGDFDELWCD